MIIEFNGRTFRKSSYSGPEPDSQCVAVASPHNPASTYEVRDSKDMTRAALTFGRAQWLSFLGAVKAGTQDLPTV